MDYLKRIFQCVNPGTDNSSGNSHDVSEMESSSSEPVKEVGPNLFQSHYKNYKHQHLASLAESQAVFEMQKQYLEKRIQYINIQINQFDRLKISELGQKVLQIEEKYENIQEKLENIQEKLEILKGDAEWVKFE